jgi:hypothetical protein
LIGFSGQRTNELKSETSPNNLYEPMPGYDQVQGDFGHLSISSLTDKLARKLPLKGEVVQETAQGIVAVLGKLISNNTNNHR